MANDMTDEQLGFDLGGDTPPPTSKDKTTRPGASNQPWPKRDAIQSAEADPSATRPGSGRKRRGKGTALAHISLSAVGVHPSLGIDLGEFSRDHAGLMDDIAERLAHGERLPPPHVVLDGGRYLAINQIEQVAVAHHHAGANPNWKIAVLVVEAPDDAQTVREQVAVSRGRSGWEQYSAVRAVFENSVVAEKLRQLELPANWKSKISKIMKVGRLDPAILDAVRRFTIPVREAGQVVDAWNDADKRVAMAAVLADLRQEGNDRLDAKICFAAMLTVARPAVVEPSWREDEAGARHYVTADGSVLAVVEITAGGWSATGTAMSAAQWQAFGKNMPKPAAG